MVERAERVGVGPVEIGIKPGHGTTVARSPFPGVSSRSTPYQAADLWASGPGAAGRATPADKLRAMSLRRPGSLRWLQPGLHIKRWLLLMGVSVFGLSL